MSTPNLPSNDPWGGACTGCGAGLAADQRYCLACGTRRDGARLPYRDALASEPRTLPAPATVYGGAPVQAYGAGGVGTPTLLTTLAALACVLLAFGVGVLVGGDDGGSSQPLVVPAAAAAATPTTAAAPTDTTAQAATTTAKEEASSADASDEESATPTKPKAAPKKLVESSKKAIQGLEKAKTPEEYAEQSAKLPDVVVTGGGK